MTEHIKQRPGRKLDPLLLSYEVQETPPDVQRANDEWSRTKEARNTLKAIISEGGTSADALGHLKERYGLTTDAAVYNLWNRYVRQAKRELGMLA